MSPGGNRPERETEDFRYRTNCPFVVAWLVSFKWWENRSKHIVRSAVRWEKTLNTGAGGFDGLNKNELVRVRNDHRQRLNGYGRAALTVELLSAGQKHRNCLECERIEEYLPNAQASVAL